MTIEMVLATWWKRDADPSEIIPIYLGVEWDGTAEQLVAAADEASARLGEVW